MATTIAVMLLYSTANIKVYSARVAACLVTGRVQEGYTEAAAQEITLLCSDPRYCRHITNSVSRQGKGKMLLSSHLCYLDGGSCYSP